MATKRKPQAVTGGAQRNYVNRETARTVEWGAQEYDLMARVFDDIDLVGLSNIRARNAN